MSGFNITGFGPKNPNAKPELKGVKGGNCNRTACQMPGANWYNPYTYAHYCKGCADLLNETWEQDNRRALAQGKESVMTKRCEPIT